jgi:hypothetical protein
MQYQVTLHVTLMLTVSFRGQTIGNSFLLGYK